MDVSAPSNPFSDSISRVSSDILVPGRLVEEQELLYQYKSSRLRGEYAHPRSSYMLGFTDGVADTTSHGPRKIN
jgi:hypothetical protein